MTSHVFHLVGRRASIEPLGRRRAGADLVLTGEAAGFDVGWARGLIAEVLGGSLEGGAA